MSTPIKNEFKLHERLGKVVAGSSVKPLSANTPLHRIVGAKIVTLTDKIANYLHARKTANAQNVEVVRFDLEKKPQLKAYFDMGPGVTGKEWIDYSRGSRLDTRDDS